MSEAIDFDIEINDLPAEETLTAEEKERIAGGSRLPAFAKGGFTSPEDRHLLSQLPPHQQQSAIAVWSTYAKAEPYLLAFAQKICAKCGPQFRLIKGPMKSLKRAHRKLDEETPFHGMKDIVRVTIVVPQQQDLQTVARVLEDEGNRAPWFLSKSKEVHAVKDIFRYSGLNYGLSTRYLPGESRMENPVNLEIQANVPWMVYGKEIEEDFVAMLGGDDFARGEFTKIQGWTAIRSGLGHALYEIWEVASAVDKRKAEELSQRYYTYLRDRVPNGPGDREMFSELCRELEEFFARYPAAPKHPVRGPVSLTPRGPVAPRGPGLQRASAPMLNNMPVQDQAPLPPLVRRNAMRW